MMHHNELLQDLAIIMLIAGCTTLIFHRLKQPVVLGYILAGLILGPYTPPFSLVQNIHTIQVLAEFGVILLMFSIGQHFQLSKLFKIGMTAVIVAIFEIALMLWLGYQLGIAFGWKTMDSLFLGAIISISSTTIIIKALQELNMVKQKFATLIFGILIIEDILAIALLTLLSSIAMTGGVETSELLQLLGKLGVFLVMIMVIGLLSVPKILRYVAQYRNQEMLLIITLSICFGMSLIAALVGYSVALGAFLAGVLVAESRENVQIEHLIQPVRDMFSAVFFVTIGMMIDPSVMLQYLVPILLITLTVIFGKVVSCFIGAFFAGNNIRTSLRIGMGLAQIGEFSFIIAQLGLTLKVTSDFLYPIAVMVSALTTLSTPFLIKHSDRIADILESRLPKSIVSIIELYPRWIEGLAQAKPNLERQQMWQILWKMSLPIGLNIVFIASLFLVAKYLNAEPWLSDYLVSKTIGLWFITMLLSVPILIHSVTKFRALAMALAEISTASFSPNLQVQLQSAFNAMIFGAGTLLLGIWFMVLSYSLLPVWQVLVLLSIFIMAIVIRGWRRFNQFFSSVHVVIRDNIELTQPASAPPALLQAAQLTHVTLPEHAPVIGKLIREVALRSQTNVSIVGLERQGVQIINPSLDEELYVGDSLLLLGLAEHLEAARRVLIGEMAVSQ
jgi:CPA2 family monovalent cation:H+ antiporter-2